MFIDICNIPRMPDSSSSFHCMVCLESGANVPAPCKNEEASEQSTPPLLCFHQVCLDMVWASQNSTNLRCPHCNVFLQGHHNNHDQPYTVPHIDIIQLGKHKIQGMLHSWLPYSRETDYINECSSSTTHSITNTSSSSPILNTSTCNINNNNDNHNTNNRRSLSNDLMLLPIQNSFWIRGPCFITAKRDAPMNSEETNLVLNVWTEAILQVLGSYCGFSQQQSSHTSCTLEKTNQNMDPNSLWKCQFVNLNYNLRISVSLVRTAIINSQGSFIQDGFVLMAEHCRYLPRRSCCHSSSKRLCSK